MRSAHSMPYGAQLVEGGVRFRLWAPGAARVRLHLRGRPALDMRPVEAGFFERVVADAGAGDRYAYSFDEAQLRVPDPASRFNPEDVHAPSEVVDPRAYEWRDGGWRGRPWHGAVLYELHVGSFTPEGDLAAAAGRLDYLAELGATAVELMPLADTPGRRNWGYDGVLPFAPESRYGRPEDLKRFVDAAHARRLMVFLDVVYNHFGPDGNYLHLYAPQFFSTRHATPWGGAINFDGPDSGPVRRFFIDNALYWLEEYHFDGLRLDAVHAIADDSDPSFLDELAAAVAAFDTERPRRLVLENVRNEAHYLRPAPARRAAPSAAAGDASARAVSDVGAQPTRRRPAYDAQWNDDFHHAVHVALTGEVCGYYRDFDRPVERLLRCLTEGFAYQGEASAFHAGARRGEPSADLPADAFVNFLQNHDQVGNRAHGERLHMLAASQRACAAETLLLLLPTPILLFMGEEFHAPNPFPFFSDFEGELGRAVTEGRRREFADFFAGAAAAESIPDPNDEATAVRARLDWAAARNPDSREALARYRRLLALRGHAVAPRLPATALGGRMLSPESLTASWRLRDAATLSVVANLGARDAPAAWPAGEVLAASAPIRRPLPAVAAPWSVVWFLAP